MKRRSFLKSLCAALVSTKLALEFGAQRIFDDVRRFKIGSYGWIEVWIEVLPSDPDWNCATHEYRRDWPIGGVPQPMDRVVDNPYAGYADVDHLFHVTATQVPILYRKIGSNIYPA